MSARGADYSICNKNQVKISDWQSQCERDFFLLKSIFMEVNYVITLGLIPIAFIIHVDVFIFQVVFDMLCTLYSAIKYSAMYANSYYTLSYCYSKNDDDDGMCAYIYIYFFR